MPARTQRAIARIGRIPSIVRAELVVLVSAFAARLFVVVHSAGFRGSFGYDASVYYAASDALFHGRLPYGDYTLVHPPGIALALMPFVLMGRLTSDHVGFAIATLAWMVLGSVNAMLVVRVACRMGVGQRAALVGGMSYALWPGAVNSEFLVRLEPLGNFCMLCGLLAYLAAESTARPRTTFLCGLGFGAAAAVKIWWIVPVGVIVAWHLSRSRRARLPFLLAGASAALLAIDGPFFVAAPRQMTSMVVFAQFGRNRASTPLQRVLDATGAGHFAGHLSGPEAVAVAVLVVGGFVALAAMAWQVPAGKLAASILLAQLITLQAGPSWYTFYDDFTAPCLTLLVAAAARPRRQANWSALGGTQVRRLRAGIVVFALGLALTADTVFTTQAVRPFPYRQLAASVAHSRCVMSDSPMPLIQLDVLSSDLEHGCANWVDVSARTYGVDAASAGGKQIARSQNPRWQHDLRHYLFSGDRVLLFRAPVTGIGPGLRRSLHGKPALGRSGGITVFETKPRGDIGDNNEPFERSLAGAADK